MKRKRKIEEGRFSTLASIHLVLVLAAVMEIDEIGSEQAHL
jgi:hypothetical protein